MTMGKAILKQNNHKEHKYQQITNLNFNTNKEKFKNQTGLGCMYDVGMVKIVLI